MSQRGAKDALSSTGRRPRRSALQAEIANLVEDLRQPLATISALASAGRQAEGVPDEVRRLFSDILDETRRATALCKDLPARQAESTFALDALAERAALRARARFGADVTIDGGAVSIAGDITSWRVLLDGLLEDACRAAGPSGAVELTVTTEGHELVLAVDDSGTGYETAHRLSTSGLELAQRIAEQHGGRVTVGQSDLGGASVRVVLPSPADQG